MCLHSWSRSDNTFLSRPTHANLCVIRANLLCLYAMSGIEKVWRRVEKRHRIEVEPELRLWLERDLADLALHEEHYLQEFEDALDDILPLLTRIKSLPTPRATTTQSRRYPRAFRKQLELVLFVLDQDVELVEVRQWHAAYRRRRKRFNWIRMCQEWDASHPSDAIGSPDYMRSRYYKLARDADLQEALLQEVCRRFQDRFARVVAAHSDGTTDLFAALEGICLPVMLVSDSEPVQRIAARGAEFIDSLDTPRAKVVQALRLQDLVWPSSTESGTRLRRRLFDDKSEEYRRALDESLGELLSALVTEADRQEFTSRWGETPYTRLAQDQLELMEADLRRLFEPLRQRLPEIQNDMLHKHVLDKLPKEESAAFVARWGESPFTCLSEEQLKDMEAEIAQQLRIKPRAKPTL